jgi:hypothetical protein
MTVYRPHGLVWVSSNWRERSDLGRVATNSGNNCPREGTNILTVWWLSGASIPRRSVPHSRAGRLAHHSTFDFSTCKARQLQGNSRCEQTEVHFLEHTVSTFLIMLASINLSVRGLPCGPPNKSSAVRMCRLARIAAMIPITLFLFCSESVTPASPAPGPAPGPAPPHSRPRARVPCPQMFQDKCPKTGRLREHPFRPSTTTLSY